MSITERGFSCQLWSDVSPHSHGHTIQGDHNYCRNPGGGEPRVWCYTTDPDTRWDYCSVDPCDPETGNI